EPIPKLPPQHQIGRWKKAVPAAAMLLFCFSLVLAVALMASTPEISEKPQPPGDNKREMKSTAALKPGIWHDLLDEKPVVRVKPERFAWHFDPDRKELWWDTEDDCLIRIGSTQSLDYEMEVTFEQAVLSGLRGLALGLPPAAAQPPN